MREGDTVAAIHTAMAIQCCLSSDTLVTSECSEAIIELFSLLCFCCCFLDDQVIVELEI